MTNRSSENENYKAFAKTLQILPPVARYARNRGVPYLASWCHRLTGILMIIFIGVHIYTLSFLTTPDAYADKMSMHQLPGLAFFEWALAIPVIFHSLNGGRLLLYESFRYRRDDIMIKWVAGLTLLYTGILGVLIQTGNQTVSPGFFWLTAVSAALITAYGLYARIRNTRHMRTWKLQRITGAFLLVMIPSHFLFMHLNPQVARDAGEVAMRMQNFWIKLVDAVLVISVLYHGGYGLVSILADYTTPNGLRKAGIAAASAAMAVAAWFGLKLIVSI
jgi:succinate dehydrogenase / fumarate reductase cytochrome b subunit